MQWVQMACVIVRLGQLDSVIPVVRLPTVRAVFPGRRLKNYEQNRSALRIGECTKDRDDGADVP